MDFELEALKANRTCILTHFLVSKSPIGYHWVYKTKHRSDDSIERYKVCLVTKGYT